MAPLGTLSSLNVSSEWPSHASRASATLDEIIRRQPLSRRSGYSSEQQRRMISREKINHEQSRTAQAPQRLHLLFWKNKSLTVALQDFFFYLSAATFNVDDFLHQMFCQRHDWSHQLGVTTSCNLFGALQTRRLCCVDRGDHSEVIGCLTFC